MKERSATKFSHDTEEFFNPKITKVEVTVEGFLMSYMLRTWNIVTNMMK